MTTSLKHSPISTSELVEVARREKRTLELIADLAMSF